MTLKEKLAKVHELLDQPASMGRFISPIREGSLHNRTICGVTTGYAFGLNNLSYRGIWLSTFESVEITVDGQKVPQKNAVLSLKSMKIPFQDLAGHSEVFWGAEDDCELIVYQIGGLAPGKHSVAVDMVRRNDFGHTVGNDTDGYEEAEEFLRPMRIHDEALMEVARHE